jgi:nitroreductase
MSNQVLDIISERFTARSFTGEAVDQGDLEKIALAGVQSPSATNQQLWRISVLTNRALIDELDQEGVRLLGEREETVRFQKRILERGGKLFYNAPAIIFVAVPDADAQGINSVLRDSGIVVENLALAAQSLGLGNCICGLAGVPFTGEKSAYFKEKLKFPEGWGFGIALLVGKTDAASTPHEPDLAKITYIA